MSAYVLLIKEETVDKDELAAYSAKAAVARGDHPITPRAYYGELETWEGPAAEGVVILEFPDMEAAKGWYFSPAYQEAKENRLKGAKYRVMLVNGVA